MTISILILIGVIIYLLYLTGRVRALEEILWRENEKRVAQATATDQPPAPLSPNGLPIHPSTEERPQSFMDPAYTQPATLTEGSQAPRGPRTPTPGDIFIEWVKKDFFVKLGALLLLIGFGWFVSYAFANNWIGPQGRITLGLLAGIAFMMLGAWRITLHRHQGGLFAVLGSTIVLLTVFAARELYGIFDPYSALAIMFLSVVFVAFVSVRHHSKGLAVASIVLAGVAPFLTNAPTTDVSLLLLSYLMLVVAGTLWVVYLTGARELVFLALMLTYVYFAPFLFQYLFLWGSGTNRDTIMLFGFLFTALFLIANLVSIVHKRSAGVVHGAHIATAAGTGIFLVLCVFATVSDSWQSLMLATWMLVFTGAAFVAHRLSDRSAPFYVYAAISLVLLAAATAVELSGPALTFAFTMEVLVILLLALHLKMAPRVVNIISLLYVLPILLSLEHFVSANWNKGIFHGDFAVLFFIMAALGVSGALLIAAARDSEKKHGFTGEALVTISVLYFLALLWTVTHGLLEYDAATTLTLTLYTIMGLAAYVYGTRTDSASVRLGGALLLGFVVGRLLLVEVWQMDMVKRIGIFFIVGMLLISTAFITKRSRKETKETTPNDQTI
jgi:uncharacterized membrane protein